MFGSEPTGGDSRVDGGNSGGIRPDQPTIEAIEAAENTAPRSFR